MKKLKYILFTVGVMGVLSALAGFKKDVLPEPPFPLEEETVADALEKSGLPGEISASETDSYGEGHIVYTVRSQTETYSEQTSPEEAEAEPGTRLLVATASSAVIEEGRQLQTIFDQRDISEQFAWEDWKQQIIFATLLYGGFEDEEAVYREFSSKAFPEEEGSDGETKASWEASFPKGYCRITYSPRKTKTEGEYGIPATVHSGTLFVTMYESEAHFQNIQNMQEHSTENTEPTE